MSKTTRKKYTPKPVNPLAHLIAIQGSLKLSHKDVDMRAQPIRDAIGEICQGRGTREEWAKVFDAANMLEEFAKMPKVMQDAHDYIDTLQQVVVGILDRQKKTGTKALYPGEREDLQDFASLWGEVLETVTHAEYFRAEEGVRKRLARVLAGNVGDAVVMTA